MLASLSLVLLGAAAVRAQATVAQVAQAAPANAPVAANAASYPNMPTQWPDPDEAKGTITIDALLKSPLVVEGMKRVQAAVPANILALPPSKVTNLTIVTYPGGEQAAQAACYQPGIAGSTIAVGCKRPEDYTTCAEANSWALTYDDGPTGAPDSPNSNDLMAALAKLNNQKATIFVAGSPAFYNPAILKAFYDAGHEIAVHTWTHFPMTAETNEQIVAEILFTEAFIFRTTGVKPQFFRPPYGDVDDRVRAIIAALGYKNILWARDSLDTTVPPGPAGLNTTLTLVKSWFTAQPGFISLEHNITPTTTAISIAVLNAIAATPNFPLKLTTVGQCIGASPYVNSTATNATTTTAAGPATVTSVTSSTKIVPQSTPTKSAASVATQSSAADILAQGSGLVAGIAAAVAGLFM